MNDTNRNVRMLGIVAAVVFTLPGCATRNYHHAVSVTPECVDSTYVGLKQQHPDSLSEREWQRLQSMDGQCADARLHTAKRDSTKHEGWLGKGRTAGIGVMTAVMIAMMVTMW